VITKKVLYNIILRCHI